MLKDIILIYPYKAESLKVFFPDKILFQMNWSKGTPLRIRKSLDSFGVVLQEDKSKSLIDQYRIKTRKFYTAPFVNVPILHYLKHTTPVVCSYGVVTKAHPKKLAVIFPSHIKIVNGSGRH